MRRANPTTDEIKEELYKDIVQFYPDADLQGSPYDKRFAEKKFAPPPHLFVNKKKKPSTPSGSFLAPASQQ